MNEYDRRWEAMTNQLNKEYKATWIKLVIYILAFAVSIGLACWIWNSDLPTWVKVWLIG